MIAVMIAALTYLSRMIDQTFELRMRRAAVRIRARQQLFPHHAG